MRRQKLLEIIKDELNEHSSNLSSKRKEDYELTIKFLETGEFNESDLKEHELLYDAVKDFQYLCTIHEIE